MLFRSIVAPCVNRSQATFSVSEGQVVYALGALKNVGVEAMKLIVAGRAGVPFVTLFDLARRVDLKRVGKRPLEMLARAGAFDGLDRNRARVFEALDPLVAYSAAVHEAKASAQVSLFGEAGTDIPEPRVPFRDDWLTIERLTQEQAAIGFYLSGHPLDDAMGALRRRDVKTLAEVAKLAERGALVAKMAGAVASRQEKKSARGNRYAFVQMSDPSGGYEVTVFSDVLDQARDLLEPGKNVVITAEVTLEGETLKLLARSVQSADAIAEEAGATGVRIHLAGVEALGPLAVLLARTLAEGGRSRAPVRLCVLTPATGEEVDVELAQPYPVTPKVRAAIKSFPGVRMLEDL